MVDRYGTTLNIGDYIKYGFGHYLYVSTIIGLDENLMYKRDLYAEVRVVAPIGVFNDYGRGFARKANLVEKITKHEAMLFELEND